ncbi:MAG: hypothetical protein ABIJ08_07080 [Nanoarchaeota archaeon]
MPRKKNISNVRGSTNASSSVLDKLARGARFTKDKQMTGKGKGPKRSTEDVGTYQPAKRSPKPSRTKVLKDSTVKRQRRMVPNNSKKNNYPYGTEENVVRLKIVSPSRTSYILINNAYEIMIATDGLKPTSRGYIWLVNVYNNKGVAVFNQQINNNNNTTLRLTGNPIPKEGTYKIRAKIIGNNGLLGEDAALFYIKRPEITQPNIEQPPKIATPVQYGPNERELERESRRNRRDNKKENDRRGPKRSREKIVDWNSRLRQGGKWGREEEIKSAERKGQMPAYDESLNRQEEQEARRRLAASQNVHLRIVSPSLSEIILTNRPYKILAGTDGLVSSSRGYIWFLQMYNGVGKVIINQKINNQNKTTLEIDGPLLNIPDRYTIKVIIMGDIGVLAQASSYFEIRAPRPGLKFLSPEAERKALKRSRKKVKEVPVVKEPPKVVTRYDPSLYGLTERDRERWNRANKKERDKRYDRRKPKRTREKVVDWNSRLRQGGKWGREEEIKSAERTGQMPAYNKALNRQEEQEARKGYMGNDMPKYKNLKYTTIWWLFDTLDQFNWAVQRNLSPGQLRREGYGTNLTGLKQQNGNKQFIDNPLIDLRKISSSHIIALGACLNPNTVYWRWDKYVEPGTMMPISGIRPTTPTTYAPTPTIPTPAMPNRMMNLPYNIFIQQIQQIRDIMELRYKRIDNIKKIKLSIFEDSLDFNGYGKFNEVRLVMVKNNIFQYYRLVVGMKDRLDYINRNSTDNLSVEITKKYASFIQQLKINLEKDIIIIKEFGNWLDSRDSQGNTMRHNTMWPKSEARKKVKEYILRVQEASKNIVIMFNEEITKYYGRLKERFPDLVDTTKRNREIPIRR